MSAFTDAMADLLARELACTTEAGKRAIREERAELLAANHRGELPDEPLPPAPDVSQVFDAKLAQTGERDE